MNELVIVIWLLWLYGLIMSFTLLNMKRVGWWMLASYIPWAIAGIVSVVII